MSEIEPEDIAAVRQEDGGLRALMRAQIAIGKARREKPAPTPTPKPPGHKPGAWPSGTSPPGPVRNPYPPAAWLAALADFRQWRNANFPDNEPTEET